MVSVPATAVQAESGIGARTALAYSGDIEQTSSETEKRVREYFKDIPLMAEVAYCESHFEQVDKNTGEIKRGFMNAADVGVMQINERYHAETAKKLGIDIYSLEGNMQYARYLYEHEGTQPWSASRPCWGGKALAMK